MALPEADVAHICRWVDALNAEMPDDVLAQLRYETETYRNAVTLVEYRLVDLEKPGGDWFRVPVRAAAILSLGGWELFYADRNSNSTSTSSQRPPEM